MATGNAINANSTGLVKYDGAGTFSGVTTTNHDVLVGAASNGITNIALTNGQVLIGSTGADPVAATITAGTGITTSTGAGSFTINSVGAGLTWSVVTVNGSFTVNTGVIANKAGLLSMALPASSAVGDIIAITGMLTALGWSITQGVGQQIFFGTSSTSSGVGGSLSSVNVRDSVMLVCIVANASWNVINSIGNLTVV